MFEDQNERVGKVVDPESVNYYFEEKVQPKPKKWPLFLVGFLGILLGCIATVIVGLGMVGSRISFKDESSKEVLESLQGGESGDSKFSTILSIIETYYYQDVDNDKLVNGVYKGVVESLDDPYSEYYTAEEYQDLMATLTGNYAGIGALLQKNAETGAVSITKVYKDTPAEKAGLKEGDYIISADGYLATDEGLDTFVQHIRGEEGTDVELVISRDGEEQTIVCTRASIATPTVEHQMLEGNVGYIAVSQFTDHTYKDFVEAYKDLEKQGMTAVVFDMRNNGGGLLDSVVEMLDYLLPKGTVVYTMDKEGNREDFLSDEGSSKDIPMVVLVNGNTASAAEIFTGAIRDFEYGTIIGTNTFGKGIVQSTIPLSDGSALKLTTQTYYTPSGECIHGKGIAPDIELEYEFQGGEDDAYSVDLDNQIQKALEVLRK
ncbi:S41 family peptidase [Pseudobutyrivibrio xylanivorans]|uniref:Carboxyl-terminal processing protease n=1 Tax=Pseudobutyrivibrio xylanivorans TaxID=185007 RepID=A0A1G5S523_PSEXY|nr:S41 family peptidase [Pseudobutyrivibrio xylanivorans]SCZ81502.1 carboxyl-terminal processing protease [Pseudobutyrivibrio xylanivorans]